MKLVCSYRNAVKLYNNSRRIVGESGGKSPSKIVCRIYLACASSGIHKWLLVDDGGWRMNEDAWCYADKCVNVIRAAKVLCWDARPMKSG